MGPLLIHLMFIHQSIKMKEIAKPGNTSCTAYICLLDKESHCPEAPPLRKEGTPIIITLTDLISLSDINSSH